LIFPTAGIVSEHASDVTSSAVRTGAIHAMTQLLDAPQSHGVLRDILPAMGNLIHDKVEKVRLAVVNMLLRIKTIPNIKYYHIVPLEHLTARFIDEAKHRNPSNSVVASALTSLMINSYFPESAKSSGTKKFTVSQDSNSTDAIRRALQFCTDEPEAAIVFYSNVSKYRSFSSIVQLLVQLFRCLHTSVEDQIKRDARSRKSLATMKRRRRFSKPKAPDLNDCNSPTGNDISVNEEVPPIEVLATIAEVIRTLWESIEPKLQRNEEWKLFLVDEFSGSKLSTIFSYYDSMNQKLSSSDDDDDIETLLIQEDCSRICFTALSCAGRLPSKSVVGLMPCIVTSIQHEIQSDLQRNRIPGSFIPYLALLCVWDMAEQAVLSIAVSIRSSLYNKIPSNDTHLSLFDSPVAVAANSKKRRSGRTVATSSPSAASAADDIIPLLAVPILVNVLHEVLGGSDSDSLSVRNAFLSSANASEVLEKLFHDGVICMQRLLDDSQARDFTVRNEILLR
jgi:condensin-2 complex subunit G2